MAAGYLTTTHTADILYVKPAVVSKAIRRAPELFPRTLKFGGRWAVAATDLHRIITALDWEDGSDQAGNALWVNLLTGGIPNLDFWLDEHVHLRMSILHRRVDYRSGCRCGLGLDDIDPDLVETEKFNYLFEPGETQPVTPFSFTTGEEPV